MRRATVRAPGGRAAAGALRPGPFVGRFLPLLALGLALPLLGPVRAWVVDPWNGVLAAATAHALAATGLHARAIAGSVVAGPFALEVVDACNGLDVAMVFAAGVLALGGAWRARLHTLAAGGAILLALNLLRLMSLSYLGLLRPAWVDAAHYLVWQAAMMLVVLLLWSRAVARLLPEPVAP